MFKISVIIPSYNRAGLLPRALDSVLAQSHPAAEIIVVDDGSTDHTAQLLAGRYARVDYVRQPNRGVSAARNAGLARARHEWLCLLDSDDSWRADKLEKQVQALRQNPAFRLCHTDETWYRRGKLLKQRKKHAKRGGDLFQHCLPLCAISPSSVMIHKGVLEDVGGFDESLPACEDYDMWLRICRKYPALLVAEALTNKYGGHDDQLSRKHWGMDRFRILALEKIISTGGLGAADRGAAIAMLTAKIRIFLRGARKHGASAYSQRFETLLEKYARG